MKPTTIKLLKENPEAFKKVAISYGMYYCTHESFKDEKVWNSFLSEALKPDWEILEFRQQGGTIFKLYPNGEYGSQDEGNWSLWNMLNDDRYGSVSNGQISIHSVRRSDGKVFTVGDKTNQGIIEKFEISDRCMSGMYAIIGNGKWSIDYLTKLKPLFKTHDKVPVYEMDTVIPVYKKELKIFNEVSFTSNQNTDDFLYFSTRSAAEQWVNDHKPSVSIAQIREFAEKDLPFQTVEALLLHLKSKK